MNFIDRVTIKGITYYLSRMTTEDGHYYAKLPKLKKNDVIVTQSTLGDLSLPDDINSLIEDLQKDVDQKVDKEEGKGLSTNDYTNEDKAKVDSLVAYQLPMASESTLGGIKAVAKDSTMMQSVGIGPDGMLYTASSLDEAKAYTDEQLAAYESFSIEIVDALPDVSEAVENTFYLVPKKSGNGYEKYWKITDAEGNSQLDEFAGSSTEVVGSIDEVVSPSEDVDYIVHDGDVCLYYKYIGGNWCMVAGSVAKVVDTIEGEMGNAFTDYYVKNGEIYFHYRWDNENNKFVMVGSDSYSKTEIDKIVQNLNAIINNTTDDIELNASNIISVTRSLESLTNQFNALDTEGYTYYVTYGHGIMQETGEESDYILTLYEVKEGNESIKSQCIIQGGGGQTSTTTMSFERVNPIGQDAVFTKDDKAEVSFNFTAVDTAGESVDCTYVLKREGQVVKNGNLKQGLNVLDLTEFVSVGTQKFTLNMIDPVGSILPKTWKVQIVDVRIESTFKDDRTYAAGNDVNFTYTPYGSVSKTVHFKLDGEEIGTFTTSSSGTQQSFKIPAKERGTHLFECYITAVVNEIEIETDHIFKDIIWYDENVDTPVIGCIYRYDYYGAVDCKQYNALNIDYHVFDPSTSTPSVILYEDGQIVTTKTLDGSSDTWAYKSSVVGEHILKIQCEDTVVEIHVNTTELGYDISPVTANLAFDFNPIGKSNSDVDRLWTDTNTGVTMSVSDNFDWSNGGYQLDADGNQYFCVKAGTTATINYNIFGNDLVMDDGAEFKFVFKVTNVGNPNALFLTCKSGADIPVGLEMNAHSANIYAGSTEKVLNIPYCEDDVIEFEYNINTLGDEDDAESYIMTYEDGVPYRPLDYKSSNRLYQQDKVPVVIGSEDCDVHIYRMKFYNSSLRDSEILDNFIADAPNAEEMIARYERNQIYDENGNLSPEKLAEFCPNLKIIMIECPHFTEGKDYKISGTTIRCIHTGGDLVLDNWTAVNCQHSGQGTTSDKYGISSRNIRLIMNRDNTELTLGDGTTKYYNGEGKVSLTRDSVPNNFFNIKVNVASSENANNALLAKRYEDFLPYQTVANKRDSKVKTTMEFVNCVVFVKETGDETERTEFQDNEWHFYSIGNLGDDKKTDKTRVNDSKDYNEFTVEIADNDKPCSTFPSGQDSYPIAKEDWKAGNTAYDNIWITANDEEGKFKTFGNGTYEFRYEKSGISDEQRQQNIQRWCDMYGWVVTSTDEEFVNEFGNWFIEDSALYFYLFTERYTMTDNRAKNTFWHCSKIYLTEEEAASDYYKDSAQYYEINNEKANINGGYRFDFWDYDNDTGLGIDNNGVLNRPYGKEDIDLDDNGSYIFNGATSTFFMRIRNLMSGGLNRVYNAVADAWNAENLINEFDNWQAEFPEELWRLDFERKYYRPFVGTSIDNSIPKADKGYLKERYNGRKKYHRRQFERDQEIYMGTKYLASSVTSDTNDIMFRLNSPVDAVVPYNYTIYLTPYSDMYATVSWGNGLYSRERVKAGQRCKFFGGSEKKDDTMVNVYAANRIMEIDGLSTCYIKTNRFGNATKLKKLIIGNDTDGYSNPFMETLNLGNNYLLKELYLKNCTGLIGDLNMTKLGNLETLIADGTSLDSVTFATNGKISTAILPETVTTVIMKNLNYLSDDTLTMPIKRLDTFTEENCPYIDEKEIVLDAVNTLTELRLVGIDWTGENSITNSTLLNQILKMYKSHITGKVHIAGSVRQRELDDWAAAWPDLTVTYNGIIDQYAVTFINADGNPILDKNGDAYVQWVDQGAKPYNPIAAGDIDTPTIPSTEQYNYEFASWDGIDVNVTAPITVTAVYNSVIRTYTVRWLKQKDMVITTKENVPYGTGVKYDGAWPTMTDNEDSLIYNIFTGWDKNTGFITGNTDVYAKWDTVNGLPSTGMDLSEMSPVQIYSVATSGKAANYFDQQDYFDVRLGNDYSFTNVDESLVADELTFDGTESKVIDTGIKLFGENETSFTMAIDFEFTAHNSKEATLVSCYEMSGAEGFRLRSNGTNPVLQWGDVSKVVGRGTQRDMLVIRHIKGDDKLYLYSFNGGATVDEVYSDTIMTDTLTRTSLTSTTASIVLGAFKFPTSGVIDGLSNGIVHWAKVWLEDLGDIAAKNLVTWPHETLRFEYCGAKKYYTDSKMGYKAGASFISKDLLQYSYHMTASGNNSNAGGWDGLNDDCEMRKFCNERIYNAFPTVWKSIIKQTEIPTSAGNKSTGIITSKDYVYLPSYVEMCEISSGSTNSDTYMSEGTTISWMTSSTARIKTKDGVASNYWLRSPVVSSDKYFAYVSATGACSITSYVLPYNNQGICPCVSI